MLDKARVLSTLFTRVDDTMKGSSMIQDALKRPGPAPHLSDSEVITLALYQELIGEPREDHCLRLHQPSLRPFFPALNERRRYNRRKRDLWSVILAVRLSLQLVLDAFELEETAAIDSAPVPCVSYKRGKPSSEFVGTADSGVCSSKAIKYVGCKLHRVVSLTGLILGFLLTPASSYDNQPVVERLASFSHHLQRFLGDGAYNDAALESYRQPYGCVQLLSPAQSKQAPKRSPSAQKPLSCLRLSGETVNAQLQEHLHLSKHDAKSTWGLMTRLAAKVTAHRVGMRVTTLLGRPALQLAALAV